MVAAGNDRIFALLCEALGLPELRGDERFRTNPDRVRNREELVELLSARLRERDVAEWRERLAASGVPAAPVADTRDVVEAEQTRALGMLQPLPHPSIPALRVPALPLSFDDERALHGRPPPRVGEHTEELLRELGYDEREIGVLVRDGVAARVTRAGDAD
jgi:formyl-CoA transferase